MHKTYNCVIHIGQPSLHDKTSHTKTYNNTHICSQNWTNVMCLKTSLFVCVQNIHCNKTEYTYIYIYTHEKNKCAKNKCTANIWFNTLLCYPHENITYKQTHVITKPKCSCKQILLFAFDVLVGCTFDFKSDINKYMMWQALCAPYGLHVCMYVYGLQLMNYVFVFVDVRCTHKSNAWECELNVWKCGWCRQFQQNQLVEFVSSDLNDWFCAT